MSAEERLVADYAGTHLTIGPHPMAMRRSELAMRGVLRADRSLAGARRAAAFAWPARSLPASGRAPPKGFVFLTLEDETGIANIIIRPDLFVASDSKFWKSRFCWSMGSCRIRKALRR